MSPLRGWDPAWRRGPGVLPGPGVSPLASQCRPCGAGDPANPNPDPGSRSPPFLPLPGTGCRRPSVNSPLFDPFWGISVPAIPGTLSPEPEKEAAVAANQDPTNPFHHEEAVHETSFRLPSCGGSHLEMAGRAAISSDRPRRLRLIHHLPFPPAPSTRSLPRDEPPPIRSSPCRILHRSGGEYPPEFARRAHGH